MADAYHFINAAQLSRALEVSPFMLAKLQIRGQIPPPDGFLRGKELWNADKLPSIRATLEASQEVAKA